MDINAIIGSIVGKVIIVSVFVILFFIVRFVYASAIKVKNEFSDSTDTKINEADSKNATKVAFISVILLISAWMFRYEIYPNATGNGPSAYVLDRWTGGVTLLYGTKVIQTPSDQK